MQVEDYKGLYFNNPKDQQFFEGGAHFKYKSLVKALNKLLFKLPNQRRGTSEDSKKSNIAYNIMKGLNEKKQHRGISRNNRGINLFIVKSHSKIKTLSELSNSKSKTIKESNNKPLKSPEIDKYKINTVKSRNNNNCYYHNNSKNNNSVKYNTRTEKKNYSGCKNYQNLGSMFLIRLQSSGLKKEAQSLMALKEKYSNIFNKNKIIKLQSISKKKVIKNPKKENYDIKKKRKIIINNISEQGLKITNVNTTSSIKKYPNPQIPSNKKLKFQKYSKLSILKKMIFSNNINSKNIIISDNHKINNTKNLNINNESNFLTEVSSNQINSIKKTKNCKSNNSSKNNNIDIFISKRIKSNIPQNILLLQKISNSKKNKNKSKESSCISCNNININNNKKISNKNTNFQKNQKSRNDFKNMSKNIYSLITQKISNIKEIPHEKINSKNILTYNRNLLNIPKRKKINNFIQKNNRQNLTIDITKNDSCISNSNFDLDYPSKMNTHTNNNSISINNVANKTNKNKIYINNSNAKNNKMHNNANGNFNNTNNNFIEISLLSDSCNNVSTKANKTKINNNKKYNDNSTVQNNINKKIKQKKTINKEHININDNISNCNISNANIILKSKINISVINNLNNFTNIENINNININNGNNISISNSSGNNNNKSRNHPIKMVKVNTNSIRNEFFERLYKTSGKLSKNNSNNYINMSSPKAINHIKMTIKRNSKKKNSKQKENHHKGNSSINPKKMKSKNNSYFYFDKKNLGMLAKDNSLSKLVFQEKGKRNKKKKIKIEKNIDINNIKNNNDKKNKIKKRRIKKKTKKKK